MASFAMILLMLVSMLLILVILVQRGRGGGLAGAFGGQGGQSAFGTKAGDVFTRITIGLITVWVLLAGTSGVLARRANLLFNDSSLPPASASTSEDGVSDLNLPKTTGNGNSAGTGDSKEAESGATDDATTSPKNESSKPAGSDGAGEAAPLKSDETGSATDGK